MKLKKKKIKFSDLEFISSKQTFLPTGTSEILLKSCLKIIRNENKILDFGCGIGVVGISLFKIKKIKKTLYASDISKKSIYLCKANAKFHKVKIDAKIGSVFKPWKDFKFDLIINDISGISKKIAKVSSWFSRTSCESGNDGTLLTIEVLKNSNKYLSKNGKIIFPIISLSNKKKILSFAKSKFKSVKKIGFQSWPMPKEFYKHKLLLNKLKEYLHQ